MTLLEVVLATALLVLLASAMISTVVFANRSEIRRVRRLAAYEVASRLLLQYVDQKNNPDFPKASAPVEYEGMRFTFELFEEPAEVVAIRGEVPRLAQNTRLLRVRVYEAVEGVAGGALRGVLLAELVRPNHPLVLLVRNEDSKGRQLMDPEVLAGLSQLQPGSGGGGGSGGGK
jgi:hypothetical protein